MRKNKRHGEGRFCRKRKDKKSLLHYLWAEIWIEYKACLYSYCMIVYYCIYLLCQKKDMASILVLAEMVLCAYVMGYIQVYLLKNFDESDHFGWHEAFSMLLCSFSYTVVSLMMDWFGRGVAATGGFFLFMLFSFGCVYLVNKIRRAYDTQNLNRMLDEFKKGEKAYDKCN